MWISMKRLTEADYVLADNTVCTNETNTSLDVMSFDTAVQGCEKW